MWDAILPPELLVLPRELGRVDALLDDPVFFAPFTPYFDTRIGRPSIPMETYLRMMFLKFRYRLGFEALCREVGDSISWQRFCRIPFGTRVPHPTTLMKLTTRCGDAAVAGLNEALLAKAADAKLLRTDKVRADTTVVEAAVAYPTDSGLLAKAVTTIARTITRIHNAGGAVRTHARDRSRSAGQRARSIASKLRLRGAVAREEAQAVVARITGELAGIAESAMREAAAVRRNARRAVRNATGVRRARLSRAINDLAAIMDKAQRVVTQARSRLTGVMPDSASRLVSFHDPDARPIRKGRLGKPVEFGYKAQVVDNADGVILDHSVEIGNPADAPQLAPAIARITRRAGHAPRAVTADRGYGYASVENDLHEQGVRHVAIPRASKPSAARREFEHRKAFRAKIKWRTGCEGRINHLKRSYSWNRTELTTLTGARTWCGHGVFAHNLVKISALAS
ncbi:ISNCY family transposase (plasmid) [Mycobacterium paragordonae]|uniref:ISNCY family transposase n=1 Tax=Mycobacterium paragordonae TaxID=1389713 RepID=A0ABQ1CFD3_9MYCO|nr:MULTISPECIES: ISNCY family transposase [Mycobacterium]AYE98673.1 ISNCY family transposase [Mycobacterium paragordonae]AYE98730.1 ISNCY family transposase [Mycobacterium paragordonae]AYE99183.1 ISNCY family transposase [Mycobacterium paragordonae]AYE99500.1 ISNCY family transposase [Mycobacterium paragordonae]AYE99510.1 ISNCY family transposase [Mycobacterium paragordonae]